MAKVQAVSLRRVADDLQDSPNQMTRLADTHSITGKEKTARIAGYFFATVILRALATKLMLKFLSFKKTGQYRKNRDGHDLLVVVQ